MVRFFRGKNPKAKRDRLSDLPDELLCHIISLVPSKETVRTSILSTRWKTLFTLITTLNLDDTNEPRKTYIHNNFMITVDRFLLARKEIDVVKFRLSCGIGNCDPWSANKWIQYALWHNVKEIEVDLQSSLPLHSRYFMMPEALYTCKTLVTLKLQMMDRFVFEIPHKVVLPRLKILHLESIQFSDDNSAERLFSSCSALEELVVQRCHFKNIIKFNVSNSTLKRLTISDFSDVYEFEGEVMINAPNLVYFKYLNFIAKKHSLIDLHCLVEAHIDFGPVVNSAFYGSATTDLISGISNVESLHLSGPFSEALLLGHGPIPVLKNMTYLKIGQLYPYCWERVLNFAPCLETLVFEELPCFRANIMHPPKEVPQCLSSQIKAIKFLSFRGKKSELKMVEYFLKHAEVLENVIIHIFAGKKSQSEITEELLKFMRASKKCQVVIV